MAATALQNRIRFYFLENNSCHPSECLMWCPEGFKVDSSGCNICECAEPVSDVTTDLEGVTCPDAMCPMDCHHGFAQDVNGCQLCECGEYTGLTDRTDRSTN